MGKGKNTGRVALALETSKAKSLKYHGLTQTEWEAVFEDSRFWVGDFAERFCKGSQDQAEKRLDPLVKKGLLEKTETITNYVTSKGTNTERELDYDLTKRGTAIHKRQELKGFMKDFNDLSLEAKDVLHYLVRTNKLQNQLEIAKDMGCGRKLVSKAMEELIKKGFVYKDEPNSYYGGYTSYRRTYKGNVVGNKLKADLEKQQISIFS